MYGPTERPCSFSADAASAAAAAAVCERGAQLHVVSRRMFVVVRADYDGNDDDKSEVPVARCTVSIVVVGGGVAKGSRQSCLNNCKLCKTISVSRRHNDKHKHTHSRSQ